MCYDQIAIGHCGHTRETCRAHRRRALRGQNGIRFALCGAGCVGADRRRPRALWRRWNRPRALQSPAQDRAAGARSRDELERRASQVCGHPRHRTSRFTAHSALADGEFLRLQSRN